MPGFVGGTGTTYPTSFTELGLAIEATTGTLMSQPSYMFPVKAPKYKPDLMYIPDETLQGSMVGIYDEVQGMRYDTHGWNAPPYLDSFPVLVCAELGSPDNKTAAPTATTLASAATAGSSTVSLAATVAAGSIIVLGTGATQETHLTNAVTGSGPYTVTLTFPVIWNQTNGSTVTGLTKHQFSLLNNANQGQPPSCSLWDYDGEQWRTMTACQLDELSIKGNATGLLDYTCTWFGNAAANNATAPTTNYTTIPTPPPWTAQLLLGNTGYAEMTDYSFDFKRSVTPIPALTGTQAYFDYFATVLTSSVKITFVEQSGSPWLNDYLTGVKQSFEIDIFDQSTGDFMAIHSTNSIFTTGELDRSKAYVEVQCDVQLLPSAADATAGGKSPVQITVGNAVTTAYA